MVSAEPSSFVLWLRGLGILPPREPEPTSLVQLRRLAVAVRNLCLATAALDVVLHRGLSGVPEISQGALDFFAAFNITGLLGLALLLEVTQVRAVRPIQALWSLVAVLMIAMTLVWVQLTGGVTSYFIVAVAMQVVLYRWGLGWSVGIWTFGSALFGHLLMFGLEEVELLPRTSLFRLPSTGLVTVPAFRASAMASISLTYGASYVMASKAVNVLRTQRRELERVRREIAGLAQGARQGHLSGTELGRWFVDELLGRGGSGEVYAAHDELGEQVAIKVLLPHLADDARALERFVREQRVGAELSGDYFPRFIEVARALDGTPYIVMERLRGEDLGQLLKRRGMLSHQEVDRLVRGLARALGALHARGVVHRDLSPGNVFLVASSGVDWPDLRLLDLGLCRLLDAEAALTHSTAVMGTPGFMAPEQLMGQTAQAGPECDVFALGAIAYRALVGKAPFEGGNLFQVIDAVCVREPSWPSALRPDLAPSVDDVFRRALAKRPKDRFASAEEFASALAGALTREPMSRAG